jgi:cell division protein FtsW
MTNKLRIDWFLFSIAAGLALFGAVMVYSASAMIALKETDGVSQFTYFYKQFGFTLAGLMVMYATSKIDYRWYQDKRIVYGVLIVTAVLLLAVFGFPAINGARRWIRFPGFSFQPSEIAKIALPIFLAYFLTKNEKLIGDLKETVLPCAAVLGALGALIMLEPDLGTTMVLCAIFVAVYFAAGAKWLHILLTIGSLFLFGAAALILSPWRMKRLFAFLDPWENSADGSYQVVQGLYAIGSGGILAKVSQKVSRSFSTCRIRIRILFSRLSGRIRINRNAGRRHCFRDCCCGAERAPRCSRPTGSGMLFGIGISRELSCRRFLISRS